MNVDEYLELCDKGICPRCRKPKLSKKADEHQVDLFCETCSYHFWYRPFVPNLYELIEKEVRKLERRKKSYGMRYNRVRVVGGGSPVALEKDINKAIEDLDEPFIIAITPFEVLQKEPGLYAIIQYATTTPPPRIKSAKELEEKE